MPWARGTGRRCVRRAWRAIPPTMANRRSHSPSCWLTTTPADGNPNEREGPLAFKITRNLPSPRPHPDAARPPDRRTPRTSSPSTTRQTPVPSTRATLNSGGRCRNSRSSSCTRWCWYERGQPAPVDVGESHSHATSATGRAVRDNLDGLIAILRIRPDMNSLAAAILRSLNPYLSISLERTPKPSPKRGIGHCPRRQGRNWRKRGKEHEYGRPSYSGESS